MLISCIIEEKPEIEILQYSNFDLESVVTPVNIPVYEQLLKEVGYDERKTQFLVNSFRSGFPLHYHGDQTARITSNNLILHVGDETILWNKVMKEVKCKRYAGPFKGIPYEFFIQSPIGLVPKDGGKSTRLIFHLSHPRKTGKSVNANIPTVYCSVSYPDFMEAVQLCMKEGVNCKMSKSDMSSAFRNLGMKIQDFKWLVMKARSPLDGQWYFFIDKCLPFGSSISCAHFQAFSDSVSFIVKYKTKKANINYLDDYLFVAALKRLCDQQMKTFLAVCQDINFPVALEKTVWACSIIIFLGLLLDAEKQLICIPVEKIDKAFNLISKVEMKKKVQVHELQKLTGFLNFLCRAIVPGRAFTRRFYAYISTLESKLKPHHHVRVNEEMRSDLQVWKSFLSKPTAFARPFLDYANTLEATKLNFYTDSSGNFDLGMGGICGQSWMFAQWQRTWMERFKPSIEYLELYAVTAATLAWIRRFANQRVIIFCDNISVVEMINSSSSRCRNCMVLIRLITLKSIEVNVRIFARHVKGKNNEISDSLSRLKFEKFAQLTQHMNMEENPTPVPKEIWPLSKIWTN